MTFRSGSISGIKLLGGLGDEDGSHGCCQTFVSVPEPIVFLSPAFSRDCAAMRLLQTYEGEFALVTVMGVEFL